MYSKDKVIKSKYKIVFTFMREMEKSLMVKKKSKTINKVLFVPKSLISNERRYTQVKENKSSETYEIDRIELELPRWYVHEVLGFYR